MIRKLTLPLLAGALLAAPHLHAQPTIGAVAGIATGKLFEEFNGQSFSDDDDGLTSIVLGLSYRRQLGTGPLMLAPEVMYVAKGANDGDGDWKLSMSYIEVPVLFRYGFQTTGEIKPFVMAGPSLALQLSCNVEEDGDKESCDDAYGEDGSYGSFDFGLVLGAGLSRDRLSLSVRYDLGLMNIANTDPWVSKNRAIMILLGFDI